MSALEPICDATIDDWGRPQRCRRSDGHYPSTRHRWESEDGKTSTEWNDDAEFAKPAGSSPLRPTVQATRYTVNCMPEDSGPDAHVFEITVEYRGAGRWAVTRHEMCLGSDGEWDFGVKPYDRGDDWLNAHRFDLGAALELAKQAAPHVIVNGLTPADALARIEQLKAAGK